MRSKDAILALKRDLRAANALIERLRAQLEDNGIEPVGAPAEWRLKLRPAEVELLDALIEAYPRPKQVWALEKDSRQDHARERTTGVVAAHICNIRRALGEDVIETVLGRGYRCSAAFAAKAGAEA